jgi:hypothetical protein
MLVYSMNKQEMEFIKNEYQIGKYSNKEISEMINEFLNFKYNDWLCQLNDIAKYNLISVRKIENGWYRFEYEYDNRRIIFGDNSEDY